MGDSISCIFRKACISEFVVVDVVLVVWCPLLSFAEATSAICFMRRCVVSYAKAASVANSKRPRLYSLLPLYIRAWNFSRDEPIDIYITRSNRGGGYNVRRINDCAASTNNKHKKTWTFNLRYVTPEYLHVFVGYLALLIVFSIDNKTAIGAVVEGGFDAGGASFLSELDMVWIYGQHSTHC